MRHGELRWLLLASLGILLFASLPTLYAWQLADDDHVFTGFVYNTEDGNSYIAKMRLGGRGHWMFRLPFTTEAHRGAWLYTFHLLLGKAAATLGLSFQLTYHLARLVLGLGLLLTIYVFIARFMPDVTSRRLAWVLVTLGSGMGWLLILLGTTNWLGNLPLDFWVPEAYVFLVIFNFPHLALAEMALLWALLLLMEALTRNSVWHAALAGLSALVMTMIVPFYPIALAGIVGTYLVFVTIYERRVPWREIGLTSLMGLFTLPVVLYSVWLTFSEPVYRTWAGQLQIRSPHPLHYVLGYLPLLLPAVWGLVAFLGQKEQTGGANVLGPTRYLPIAWLVAVPLLVYMPFVSQRRLIVLVQVPLAILAAMGLQTWFVAKRWLIITYVAISSLSIVLLIVGIMGPIHRREVPIYRSGAEIETLEWLAAYAKPGEAVLATFDVGNVIPARTDLIVFAGHGPETIQSGEKKTMIYRFFQSGTTDLWRQSLLREHQLDYLFYGPQERALGAWDPTTAPYLSPVYVENDYAIFEVVGLVQP